MKNWLTASVLLLSLITLSLSYLLVKQHRKTQPATVSVDVLETFARQIKYNDIVSLDTTDLLVYDTADVAHSFKSLLEDGPRLIFRFTEDNCSSCYEAELPVIDSLQEAIGSKQVIFLCSYKGGGKILKMVRKNYSLHNPIYYVPVERYSFRKDLEALNVPYYFMANSSTLYNFFIPEKVLPAYSGIYLAQVKDNYTRYLKAHRPEKKQNGQLIFNNHILDYGHCSSLPAVAKFTFVNKGNEAAQVLKVTTDCPCMEADWSKYPVMPGDSGVVSIRIKHAPSGGFIRSCMVYANTNQAPLTLILRGDVEKP